MRALKELEADTDLQILRGAQVIGMTTTGAAKYKHLYEKLDIEVVIVEEAAELLEAHIVTSISASTKQLILIGGRSGDSRQVLSLPETFDCENCRLRIEYFISFHAHHDLKKGK